MCKSYNLNYELKKLARIVVTQNGAFVAIQIIHDILRGRGSTKCHMNFFGFLKRGNIIWAPKLIKHDLQKILFGRLNKFSGLLIKLFGFIAAMCS